MRRVCVVMLCALAVGLVALTTPAQAAGTVNLNYWLSDLSSDGSSYDQDFISFTALIGIEETPWSAIGEYSDSNSDSDAAGDTIESQRYLVGARYDFETGWYATLAWQKNEIDVSSAGGSGTIDSDGIRIGGGYDFVFEETPWSGNIDLGLGISNDASMGIGAASVSGDSDEYDVCLNFSYQFNTEGLKGNIGYRYIKIDSDWSGVSMDYKYDGPYLGIGYDFK